MTNFKRKLLTMLGVGLAVGTLLLTGIGPVQSVATITLTGAASGNIGIFGSPTASLTAATGQTGSSFTADDDDPNSSDNPVAASFDFGSLSSGNGDDTIATYGLRVRGNQKCHMTCSVSSVTVNNLSYDDGTGAAPISSANAAGFSMIKLNAIYGGSGDEGDPTAGTLNSFWTAGTNTLAGMNGGTVAAVGTTKQAVVAFTKKPSKKGSLITANNYVQTNVSFTMPTGFVWSPTSPSVNSGNGDFTLGVQFDVYPGET